MIINTKGFLCGSRLPQSLIQNYNTVEIPNLNDNKIQFCTFTT